MFVTKQNYLIHTLSSFSNFVTTSIESGAVSFHENFTDKGSDHTWENDWISYKTLNWLLIDIVNCVEDYYCLIGITTFDQSQQKPKFYHFTLVQLIVSKLFRRLHIWRDSLWVLLDAGVENELFLSNIDCWVILFSLSWLLGPLISTNEL